MGFRKFQGIEYPVPGVDTAIDVLRPGARWAINGRKGVVISDWEDDEGREPPTQEEIQSELQREIEVYDYYSYEREREKEFPLIEDQLDMLYHDIKNGNLENGSWIQSIDHIKNKFPKPTLPINN